MLDTVAPVTPTQAAPDRQPAWLAATLACPACRQPLDDVHACPACGAAFDHDGDTPRLIAPAATRNVRFTFESARASVSPEALARVLHDPPLAPAADHLPYHLDRAHVHAVRQLRRDRPGQTLRVLELGCGGGQARPWFASEGFDYVGVDIAKTRVHDWLQQHGGPDLLCDAHFLPFRDQQFDLVYAAAVTEHLACPFLVVQEAHRVLRPGGRFLGNVSFMEPWHDNSFFHMTPLGVIELLTQARFDIDAVYPSRTYSAFHALGQPGHGIFRLFRPLRYPIQVLAPLQRFDDRLLNLLRRATGKPPRPPITRRATIAGATDWIAHRPR
jgi:SAM-dependent methyltransferase